MTSDTKRVPVAPKASVLSLALQSQNRISAININRLPGRIKTAVRSFAGIFF